MERYKNFPRKTDKTSPAAERTLANIFNPFTPSKASGSIFLIRGICLTAYKMLFTRYVFLRENDIRNVLYIGILPQSRYDLFLKFPAVQIGFFYQLHFPMAEQYDPVT